jgi:hypothetical protein
MWDKQKRPFLQNSSGGFASLPRLQTFFFNKKLQTFFCIESGGHDQTSR